MSVLDVLVCGKRKSYWNLVLSTASSNNGQANDRVLGESTCRSFEGFKSSEDIE